MKFRLIYKQIISWLDDYEGKAISSYFNNLYKLLKEIEPLPFFVRFSPLIISGHPVYNMSD